MLKKLLFLLALFVSFETQTAPTAAKVWKQTKQTVKRTINFYPKAVASFYLCTGLIELAKFSSVRIKNGNILSYPNNILCYLLPKRIISVLSNPTSLYARMEWAGFNEPSNEPKNFETIVNHLKRFHFKEFKINMKSFAKWILASLALDYLISKTGEIKKEEKTESESVDA